MNGRRDPKLPLLLLLLGAVPLILVTSRSVGKRASTSPASMGTAAPDGPVLFRSSFDDSLGAEWSFDREGVWSIENGQLRAQLPDVKHVRSLATIGSDRWRDYTVEVDVCGVRGVDKGVVVRLVGDEGVGIDLRGADYHDLLVYRGYKNLGRAPVHNVNGQWHRLRFEVRKDRYRVFVDGEPKLDRSDPGNPRPRGKVALAAYTGGVGACTVLFDNLVVRAAE